MWSRISIHTPAKGVTLPETQIIQFHKFQSTLPRREWRLVQVTMSCREKISIHTPAKGVTTSHADSAVFRAISIHTPAKGVTVYFLPFLCVFPISIHTPAKGVTTRRPQPRNMKRFQSTLPRREWLFYCAIARKGIKFQSTLPRREWHKSYAPWADTSYFNPHSREGSDRRYLSYRLLRANFNPHSREGSDGMYYEITYSGDKFQSTLPRREWRIGK